MGWLNLSLSTRTSCKPVDYRYRRSTVCIVNPLCAVCASNIIRVIASVTVMLRRNILAFRWSCIRVRFWYQFCDAQCTSTHFGTQRIQPLLAVTAIHVSALPGLSHVIALTRNGLKCWVEITHKHEPTIQNGHEKNPYSRMNDHVPLVLYCSTREINVYSSVSCPTDCIWTHTPQHPDKPALPWNLNIIIRLKLNNIWGNMITCTVSSIFYSTNLNLQQSFLKRINLDNEN